MNSVELRPYQLEAVDRARSAFTPTVRRVLLVAPTGGGKTVIAAHIIEAAHRLGKRVVFFAHRRELIGQTYEKLLDAGVPSARLGVMMGKDPRTNPTAPVQIASISTWSRRELKPAADLVFIDECHRATAKTYRKAAEHYASAALLGMTATPYRANGQGLGDVFQEMVVVTTPRALIEDGYLVEPRVFSAPSGSLPDLSGIRVRGGDYDEAELAAAVNTGGLVGGIVAHWEKHAEGRRTVAFAVNVAHSKAIVDAFIVAGIRAEHLDAMTPTAERAAILRRLASGETTVLSNCSVLCEGWDMPAVKVAILARPTKSMGLYLQQGGRILRPWEGVGALILDHAGNAMKHGLPQDDREFSLESKVSKKGDALTKECPECCAIVPRGLHVCECGHEFPRPTVPDAPLVDAPGDLVAIGPEPKPPPKKAPLEAGPPLWLIRSKVFEQFDGKARGDNPSSAIEQLLPAPPIGWAADNLPLVKTLQYRPHQIALRINGLWARESVGALLPAEDRAADRMVDIIDRRACLLAVVAGGSGRSHCGRHQLHKGGHKRNGCSGDYFSSRGGKPCPGDHFVYARPKGTKQCRECHRLRSTSTDIQVVLYEAASRRRLVILDFLQHLLFKPGYSGHRAPAHA